MKAHSLKVPSFIFKFRYQWPPTVVTINMNAQEIDMKYDYITQIHTVISLKPFLSQSM